MKLAFGCDHAGLQLKNQMIEVAREQGHEAVDFGCFKPDSVDYPDYALPVCGAVLSGEADKGVVICYTGIGISISANKIHGIRCALCSDPLSARLSREHNDSNVLALGAGITGSALAAEIFTVFLNTKALGGRHQRRIDKITALENR